MKSAENISSAQVLKKTQPEEFDLVILCGGTGSTIAAWTFAEAILPRERVADHLAVEELGDAAAL